MKVSFIKKADDETKTTEARAAKRKKMKNKNKTANWKA